MVGPAWWLLSGLLALLASGCGGALPRMADAPVLWVDPDRQPFGPAPAERYVSWRYDAIDQTFLRPTSELFAFRPRRESINVNALDEVPSSSWFENRMGATPMTPEEVARGPCPERHPPVPRPWRVVGGKPDGTHPGLTIEDASGVRYLLKTDGHQPERATAADAIASSLYHAAGYRVPCNRVAHVSRDALRLAPGAMVQQTNRLTRPLVEEDIDFVLSHALRAEDGRYRVGLSRFLEGEPIGPWSYTGVREDDPNDVVPHERRRDVRGLYLLAAWTDHVDARQENTLGTWIEVAPGRGYVRHHLIDFGDCFGVTRPGDPRLSRRLGHDHYFNLPNIVVDTVTLGLIERPWLRAPDEDRTEATLGYYGARSFRPSEWAPGYPNPAFDARTEHDDAWMARILARFTPAHVEAAVAVGELTDPAVRAALARVLRERRVAILERYLTNLSPLAWPRAERGRVCLEDLTVSAGIRAPDERRYRAWTAASLTPGTGGPRAVRAAGARVCVELPRDFVYLAVDVVAQTPGRDRGGYPARLHVYARPGGVPHVAGLERLTEHVEARP